MLGFFDMFHVSEELIFYIIVLWNTERNFCFIYTKGYTGFTKYWITTKNTDFNKWKFHKLAQLSSFIKTAWNFALFWVSSVDGFGFSTYCWIFWLSLFSLSIYTFDSASGTLGHSNEVLFMYLKLQLLIKVLLGLQYFELKFFSDVYFFKVEILYEL